ncbi:MAG: hypothetical protein HYX66_04625 [Ignavibacteria bacterium]|nr:hypothetical protein [Ignavibacteria bacterium]
MFQSFIKNTEPISMQTLVMLLCVLLELTCVSACSLVRVQNLEFDRIVKIQDNDSGAVLATFALEQLNDSVVFISDFQYGQIYCINMNNGRIERTFTPDESLTDSLIEKYGNQFLGQGFEILTELNSSQLSATGNSPTGGKSKYRMARTSADASISILTEISVPAIRYRDSTFLWVPCASIVTYDRTFSNIERVTLIELDEVLQPQTTGFLPTNEGWMITVFDKNKIRQKSTDSLPIFQTYSSNGKALDKLVYLSKQDAVKPRYGGYFVTPISLENKPIVFTSQQGTSIQYVDKNLLETKSVSLTDLLKPIGFDSTNIVFVSSPTKLDESNVRLAVKMREGGIVQTYYVQLHATDSGFEITGCYRNNTDYLSGVENVVTRDGEKTKSLCTILYKKEYGYYLGFKGVSSK